MRLLFLQRFFTHGVSMLILSRAPVFVSLRALELLSAPFHSFNFDVTSFARFVRILSRDRRCDNNHRHHIDKAPHGRSLLLDTFATTDDMVAEFRRESFSEPLHLP